MTQESGLEYGAVAEERGVFGGEGVWLSGSLFAWITPLGPHDIQFPIRNWTLPSDVPFKTRLPPWICLLDLPRPPPLPYPYPYPYPYLYTMDSLHFDGYTSYSDSSAPRTPSPRTSVSSDEMHYTHSPHYKQNIDIEPVRNIFADHPSEDAGGVPVSSYWHGSSPSNPFVFNSSRGSLLQELYEPDLTEHQHQHQHQHQPPFLDQSAEPHFNNAENWSQLPSENHHTQRPHDYHMIRRATFPYVRHDRDDGVSMQPYPPFMQQSELHPYPSRQDTLYGEPLPLSSEPGTMPGEPFISSMNSSPHSSYRDFDDNAAIKLEDTAPIMVPSQTPFYRPSSSPCHTMGMSYSPHTGLPVQHTDDAASKETQYLRRRCFNCHTTEPPSWRRSTLNPGKIVCNKCGLYERTHLRPRPLRFDELRAGNKARKQSKGTVSPKAKMAAVKKEPREYDLVRRSSVSSSSSVHSGSGASDWDDNGVLRKAASAQACIC